MPIVTSENRAQSAMIMQGRIDRETNEWIRQQNQRYANTQTADAFSQRLMSHANIWVSKEAELEAERTLRLADLALDIDVFRKLNTVEEFQSAKPTMRKWVMANPTLKQSWMDGIAEGYDGEFEHYVGVVGEDDPVWQAAMNGMEQVCPTTGDSVYVTYHDVEDVDFMDQIEIQDMWAHIDTMLELEEDDPSSYMGNSL